MATSRKTDNTDEASWAHREVMMNGYLEHIAKATNWRDFHRLQAAALRLITLALNTGQIELATTWASEIDFFVSNVNIHSLEA